MPSARLVEVLGSYIHVHVIKDYALRAKMKQYIKFIAARKGSPHNVLDYILLVSYYGAGCGL